LQIDANRGDVTFAALGVAVRAAKLDRGYATFTGTSFASPLVAARFALLVALPELAAAERALATLKAAALPLGGDRGAVGYGFLAAPDDAAQTAAK
jgi:subtilisin family serine protease